MPDMNRTEILLTGSLADKATIRIAAHILLKGLHKAGESDVVGLVVCVVRTHGVEIAHDAIDKTTLHFFSALATDIKDTTVKFIEKNQEEN